MNMTAKGMVKIQGALLSVSLVRVWRKMNNACTTMKKQMPSNV
jgi:hypothetical protein